MPRILLSEESWLVSHHISKLETAGPIVMPSNQIVTTAYGIVNCMGGKSKFPTKSQPGNVNSYAIIWFQSPEKLE